MNWSQLSFWIADQLGWLMAAAMLGVTIYGVGRRRQQQAAASSVLQSTIAKNLNEPFSLHPLIDPARCAGCGACVRACPEGEILQLINHRAVMVAATKCVGHGQCEAACPFDAISLVYGTKTRGRELPRITGHFETNIPGLYIAGELGGMGLIRNAVKQGRLAVEHAASQLGVEPQAKAAADYDLVIVGSGPAGLAASLGALAAKLRYVCLEQGVFGGTISNFPRQKIIMTQPADLPLVGPMKFPHHRVSKSELMAKWDEIRVQNRLNIKEQVQFKHLAKDGDLFRLDTSIGPMTAYKVVLATGVRGTPRRLGVPGEDLAKVTYNLVEPEQYQKQHVAVVGSGNAAAEAVQYLCKQSYANKVTMLVASADFDRCNDENQNAVRICAEQGLLDLRFNTKVTQIKADLLEIETQGTAGTLRNDYLFIFIGAELQRRFFDQLGIQIDKKFGEPLSKEHPPA